MNAAEGPTEFIWTLVEAGETGYALDCLIAELRTIHDGLSAVIYDPDVDPDDQKRAVYARWALIRLFHELHELSGAS
jgi:hypothetical protein